MLTDDQWGRVRRATERVFRDEAATNAIQDAAGGLPVQIERRGTGGVTIELVPTREWNLTGDPACEFSPLAWELARTAAIWPSEGGNGDVCAGITLSSGEGVRGCGPTSTAAMRALARKLDHYVSVGAL